jgi:hypothetical protein
LTGLGQALFRVSYALGPDPEATDRFILTKR